MRAYVVPKGCRSSDQLREVERPDPQPRAGQVLVRVRAASLNYRDQAIVNGAYGPGGGVSADVVPLSDCAGEVIAVGEGVGRFKAGDRVAGLFTQVPPQGPPSAARAPLGVPLDGVLAEQVVFHEDGVIGMPRHLSYEEAACLPCAGCTAWNTLFGMGRPVRPGDIVLVLGTGGVSIFALQFARAAGARVIVTSSRDEKIERAKALGASDGINYRSTPKWDEAVMALTHGHGADCVAEAGGAGTLARSCASVARGGKVGLFGVLTNRDSDAKLGPLLGPIMFRSAALLGVTVGDRAIFEQMNRALEAGGIKPVVDRVFPFAEAPAAYRHQASGDFVGKVVISMP